MRLLMLIVVLLVSGVGPAVAGPFEDGDAAYEKHDYAAALRLWQPLAEQGEPQAQHNLGVMYALGTGVPQDYALALLWYRKAADQGYADAQTRLGILYNYGEGVTQDYVQAAAWYRKAAEQGNPQAQAHLGLLYDKGQGVPQDYVQAHMWLNLAAAGGDAKIRDRVAAKMTPAQIAEAQKLAREWKPK